VAGCVQVSTVADDPEEAARIARTAVQQRLAACAQVLGSVTSTYWWEGKLETATEWLVVMKTAAARQDALVAHVRTEHTYDVPEVIATPITAGNPAYLEWIVAETTGR
jgi:periplasmic divalent cation tolerance protein